MNRRHCGRCVPLLHQLPKRPQHEPYNACAHHQRNAQDKQDFYATEIKESEHRVIHTPLPTGNLPEGYKRPSSYAESCKQVLEFLLHFFRRGHGVCDFLAQQLAVSPPQPVCRHLYPGFAHAQPHAQSAIGDLRALAAQRVLEAKEQILAAGIAILLAQTAQHDMQQPQRPLTVKSPVGSVARRGGLRAAGLGGVEFQREDLRAAAAFLGAGLCPFVGQEMLERREQERAEASARRVGPSDGVVRQQPRKELLREVLRFLPRISRPPDIGIEGMPISLAERLQRGPGAGRVAMAGGQYDRTMRGHEYLPARLRASRSRIRWVRSRRGAHRNEPTGKARKSKRRRDYLLTRTVGWLGFRDAT